MSNCSFCDKEGIFFLAICDECSIEEVYFCENHAKNVEGGGDFSPPLPIKKQKEIHFFENGDLLSTEKIASSAEFCPECMMDRQTIQETGIFGCKKCYEYFRKDFERIFPDEYKRFDSDSNADL